MYYPSVKQSQNTLYLALKMSCFKYFNFHIRIQIQIFIKYYVKCLICNYISTSRKTRKTYKSL